MREWRRARKDYADQVKKKVQDKQEIEDTHPSLEVPVEPKVVTMSPEQATEMKQVEVRYIEKPNHIEAAINHLRAKLKE